MRGEQCYARSPLWQYWFLPHTLVWRWRRTNWEVNSANTLAHRRESGFAYGRSETCPLAPGGRGLGRGGKGERIANGAVYRNGEQALSSRTCCAILSEWDPSPVLRTPSPTKGRGYRSWPLLGLLSRSVARELVSLLLATCVAPSNPLLTRVFTIAPPPPRALLKSCFI